MSLHANKLPCPHDPETGIRRITAKFRDCPTPEVCKKHGCMRVREDMDRNRAPRQTLTDGSQVYPAHREIKPESGQQRDYVVLAEEERAKGYVRPVRRSYVHLKCGVQTTMAQSIAETYARDPGFYGGTFCVGCRAHFPVGADGEFVWAGTEEKVGT